MQQREKGALIVMPAGEQPPGGPLKSYVFDNETGGGEEGGDETVKKCARRGAQCLRVGVFRDACLFSPPRPPNQFRVETGVDNHVPGCCVV